MATALAVFATNAHALSRRLGEAVRLTDQELSATETGRRLLALTGEVRVLERRQAGAPRPARFAAAAKAILVDPALAEGLTGLEFELEFARERARAALAAGVELEEDELLAQQTVLAYALEKAAARKDFDRRLRAAYVSAKELLASRRAMAEAAAKAGEAAPDMHPGQAPRGPAERLGFYLALFVEEPEAFYSAAGNDAPFSPEAVTLSEVEDLLAGRGGELGRIDCPAGRRYCLADGDPLPGRTVRAAQALGGRAGAERVREGLGLYRSAGAEELRRRAMRWARRER